MTKVKAEEGDRLMPADLTLSPGVTTHRDFQLRQLTSLKPKGDFRGHKNRETRMQWVRVCFPGWGESAAGKCLPNKHKDMFGFQDPCLKSWVWCHAFIVQH